MQKSLMDQFEDVLDALVDYERADSFRSRKAGREYSEKREAFLVRLRQIESLNAAQHQGP